MQPASCAVYYPGQHVGVLTLFLVGLFCSKKANLTIMVPQLLLSGGRKSQHQTFCFGYIYTWHELKWLLDILFTVSLEHVNRATAQICSVAQTTTPPNTE